MSISSLDSALASKMFIAGAIKINNKKEYINELNVFPVPDGDTGTNMSLTILSAAREVAALDNPDMKELFAAISQGSLKGARGNSGVILSQILRGLARICREHDTLDIDIITQGLVNATETAYSAVMKPKEGTILTIIKALSTKAVEIKDSSSQLDEFFKEVLDAGKDALDKTPEMLPVLKEAGVVDSGGQGLIIIIEGAYEYLCDDSISLDLESLDSKKESSSSSINITNAPKMEITFGYCTEFIINTNKPFTKKNEESMKKFLSDIGDSLVCVVDGDLVKIHVHTDNPGKAIQKGLFYGELTNLKIDNLREEHREVLFKNEQKRKELGLDNIQPKHKKYGFIAISTGAGLNKIFKELGADFIIEGGQTMNPSTDDILKAVNRIDADYIFILPNNKNILLAANQASDMSNGKLRVVPSVTIPQGVSAMIAFNEGEDVDANVSEMTEACKYIKTANITYAVRNTAINGKDIKKNDILGLGDDGLLCVGKNINKTALDTLKLMYDDDELISIYYGDDIKEKDAIKLQKDVQKEFPDAEVELHLGDQPIYYYIMSIE